MQAASGLKALRKVPTVQGTQMSGPTRALSDFDGLKPPLQAVHAAMPARGACVLSSHAVQTVGVP